MRIAVGAVVGGTIGAGIGWNLASAWAAWRRPVDDGPHRFAMSRLIKFDEAEDVAILVHNDGRVEELTAVELRKRFLMDGKGWEIVKLPAGPGIGRVPARD